MSDPERDIRAAIIARLSQTCSCIEHARVRRVTGVAGQVDVLCRPADDAVADFPFAIEAKTCQLVSDGELAPWLKQAADYVGSAPQNGWPPVAASFVWLVGIQLDPSPIDYQRMMGMLQLAQHFRVGWATEEPRKGLVLRFGPSADVFWERGGWGPQASRLLGARRISGGTRKRMNTVHGG